jgi:ribonucleoside-diphosphate reductase beta chain
MSDRHKRPATGAKRPAPDLEDRVAALEAAVFAPAPTASAFRWAPGERGRRRLLPIKHPDLWALRKVIDGSHWTAQEVDIQQDKKDWSCLAPEARHFVKMQLAFFATVDLDVLDNIEDNFAKEVDCLEAKMFYSGQADQEATHTEAYGLQLEAVLTSEEIDAAFDAAMNLPAIANMRAWIARWIRRDSPLGDRLVAFAAIEGVLFSGSFAALQWLRERNKLPGVTKFNRYIARDEWTHTRFTACLVRSYLVERSDQQRVEDIFGSAIAVVDMFITDSLPVVLIGMNATLMKQYVRYQADRILDLMGYNRMFGDANPFPFMDKMLLDDIAKCNFFETVSTQYQEVVTAGASRLAVDDSVVDED